MKEYFKSLKFENCSIEERQAIYNLASRFALAEMETLKGHTFNEPESIKKYLRLAYMNSEYEVFGALLLNNQNGLINSVELFRGTIDGASVYPREVLKVALEHHASACVFFHNHPGGSLQPSNADKEITEKLKNALSFIDMRVLDHFIISKTGIFSFAEKGLI